MKQKNKNKLHNYYLLQNFGCRRQKRGDPEAWGQAEVKLPHAVPTTLLKLSNQRFIMLSTIPPQFQNFKYRSVINYFYWQYIPLDHHSKHSDTLLAFTLMLPIFMALPQLDYIYFNYFSFSH